MNSKKIGLSVFVLGLLGIIASFIPRIFSGENVNGQIIQILGTEISVLVALAGVWILRSEPSKMVRTGSSIHKIMNQVFDLPLIVWVSLGFLFVYLVFFVTPVFLNHNLEMKYPVDYLPNINPIGNDLSVLIRHMRGWFYEHQSPYTVHFYPPLTFILFSPLLLIKDQLLVYRIFTLFSLICYFLLAILALKLMQKRNIPMWILLFCTGLFSYGFQFELERGQYDIFTFLLCIWAIYIFRYHQRHRLLAYLLFSISIQLKLYPAIFIVMFVDDWRDWKNNLLRFAGIGVFNFLLLFVMGSQIFLEFVHMASTQLLTPEWIWIGNHSINSFVDMLTRDGFNILTPGTLEALRGYSGAISNLFLIIFLIAFTTAIYISASKTQEEIDGFLLLTCMIGAMIIPVSNDYKLSLLPLPMAVFYASIPEWKNIFHKIISIPLIFTISVTYFSMFVSYKYKPYFLNNAFPALFLVLLFATILNLIRYKNSRSPTIDLS